MSLFQSTLIEAVNAVLTLNQDTDLFLYNLTDLERQYLLSDRCRQVYQSIFKNVEDFDITPETIIVSCSKLSAMGIQGWAGYRRVILAGSRPSYILSWIATYHHERHHVEARWRSGNVNITTADDEDFRNDHRNVLGDRFERERCADLRLFGKQLDFMKLLDPDASQILAEWTERSDNWSDEAVEILNQYPAMESTYSVSEASDHLSNICTLFSIKYIKLVFARGEDQSVSCVGPGQLAAPVIA